jgi:hypothetical protein
MIQVFDMDGVLVDTREANEWAYRQCGVEPPPDHHTRPWQEWCTKEQHDAKAETFPEGLKLHGRELPLLEQALNASIAVVLTNASTLSLVAVLGAFPRLAQLPIVWNMRPDEKLAWLQARGPGYYWDDSEAFCLRAQKELPRWSIIRVRSS